MTVHGGIGQSVKRKEDARFVRGKGNYVDDVKLPGMLTAVVAHPLRFGAKVKSFDATKTKAVKGVIDVVAIPQGVAVLAGDFWTAKKGRDALAIEWDETGAFKLGTAEIMAEYRKLAATPGLAERRVADLRDAELARLAGSLQRWQVRPAGSEGYRKAEVTAGGVDSRELDSRSGESRRVPGLYFIGEVVDVTGWLGGYNFQWAWASAAACARSLAPASRLVPQ